MRQATKPLILIGALTLAVLLAGCASEPGSEADRDADRQDAPNDRPAGNGQATAGNGNAPPRSFPDGIYYALPSADSPDARLSIVGGSLPAPIAIASVGFDLRGDLVATVGGSEVFLTRPDGSTRSVSVAGFRDMARPSLSPDGGRVVVQALDAQHLAAPGEEDFDIYVVDLETGAAERIGNLSYNEESPEWFPASNRIAYSSFSPEEGVNLHVYDLDAEREVLRVHEGGAIHLAVSADERLILDPGRLIAYDAQTGDVAWDLHGEALGSLRGLGFEPDRRFEGQAGRGTFPLDGAFSPDATEIVLDGAVERDGTYMVILGIVDVATGALRVLVEGIEVDPALSNDHNFSQLNPLWLG